MASFSVLNQNQGLYLDMMLNTWNESFVPSFQILIRRAQTGKSESVCMFGINRLPELINNVQDPVNFPQIKVTSKNGEIVLGRYNNDFSIQGSYGSGSISLVDYQWNDVLRYINMMYDYAPLIREISRNVRVQVINLFRQVGLDSPENGRFKTTYWYDNSLDDSRSSNKTQQS